MSDSIFPLFLRLGFIWLMISGGHFRFAYHYECDHFLTIVREPQLGQGGGDIAESD